MKAGEFKYREDSRDTLFDRHKKKCWSKGIVIVPIPTPSGMCKINVLYNDKILHEGKEYYSQQPTNGVNPLTIKIRELYEFYYDKIIDKETKQLQL